MYIVLQSLAMFKDSFKDFGENMFYCLFLTFMVLFRNFPACPRPPSPSQRWSNSTTCPPKTLIKPLPCLNQGEVQRLFCGFFVFLLLKNIFCVFFPQYFSKILTMKNFAFMDRFLQHCRPPPSRGQKCVFSGG